MESKQYQGWQKDMIGCNKKVTCSSNKLVVFIAISRKKHDTIREALKCLQSDKSVV